MEKGGALGLFFAFFALSSALPIVQSMVISNDEYMNAYFVMYADYLQGNKTFTQDELIDVVRYYLTTDELAGNLHQTGEKSGEMIGDILVKAGVNFNCGPCDASLVGIRCCIYRSNDVPVAYECIGNEVMGVMSFSWNQLCYRDELNNTYCECTYGCCAEKCCRKPVSTSTSLSSTTTLLPVTTTSSTEPSTTSTTLVQASTTSTTSGPTTTFQPILTLLYVPVDWTRSMDEFYSGADVQTSVIVKSTDLKDCPSKVRTIKEDVVCRLTAPLDERCTNILEVKREVEACAKSSGENYDYVVGVWPTGFCGVVGLTFGTGTIFLGAVSEEVTTHEMGHEWGLVDEYFDACRCSNRTAYNCLDAGSGGADPAGSNESGQPYTKDYCAGGSKCAESDVTCLGNLNDQGGRCIMGPAGAPGPRAFCVECVEHLNDLGFLKC
jgi:hypothetical protein